MFCLPKKKGTEKLETREEFISIRCFGSKSTSWNCDKNSKKSENGLTLKISILNQTDVPLSLIPAISSVRLKEVVIDGNPCKPELYRDFERVTISI